MNHIATHPEEVRALRSDRARVSDLLGRYPPLSEQETREILSFLRTARHLDVGLLTSDERLRPRLDAFMEEHKSHFRVRWIEAGALIGGIGLLFVIFWLVWEAAA